MMPKQLLLKLTIGAMCCKSHTIQLNGINLHMEHRLATCFIPSSYDVAWPLMWFSSSFILHDTVDQKIFHVKNNSRKKFS